MHSDFARATVAFFAIIDPIGGIIVFEALAVGTRRRWTLASLAVVVSFAFIALFAVAGKTLLDLLGISTASFQVAAGVLLVLPAIRLVERGELFEVGTPAGGFQLDAAVVPLALPMLSGPGHSRWPLPTRPGLEWPQQSVPRRLSWR